MMFNSTTFFMFLITAVAVAVGMPDVLASTGSQALPWESPLDSLTKSLQGPVAKSIAAIAIVATGAGLIFGGELNDFTKKAMMLVLAISFMLGGVSLLSIFDTEAAEPNSAQILTCDVHHSANFPQGSQVSCYIVAPETL